MGCGCGRRAVKLLKAMGYHEDGDYLVKGDTRVPIAEAKKHHARVTSRVLVKEVTNHLTRQGGTA
jgi:hypothetical protein